MNKYELVVIVDSQLSPTEKEDILKQATDAVVKGEGKVINSQVWLEKQRFTFQIKKHKEGTYYLINFESNGGGVGKIRDLLRLNESVLRYAILESK